MTVSTQPRVRVLMVSLLLLASAALCAQKVKVEHDSAADFSKYKTYAWTDGTPSPHPVWHQVIEGTIGSELEAKGLRRMVAKDADLLVAYHAAGDTSLIYRKNKNPFHKDKRVGGFLTGCGLTEIEMAVKLKVGYCALLRRVKERRDRNLRERLPGHWIQPTDPMHALTAAIDQGINPEMLAQRIRPTQPLWTTALLLPQQGKQGSRRPAFGTGCQQPEIANRVSVAVRNVLGQSSNELLDRIPS